MKRPLVVFLSLALLVAGGILLSSRSAPGGPDNREIKLPGARLIIEAARFPSL